MSQFRSKTSNIFVGTPYFAHFQKAFLHEHDSLGRTTIITLDDVYGVTLSKGCVEALVVSKETERTAIRINGERKRIGLPPLHMMVIEMIPSEDHISISTTRILWEEINREGTIAEKATLTLV